MNERIDHWYDLAGSSLCRVCRDNQALTGLDLCEDCWAEVKGEMILEKEEGKRVEKDAA